MRTTDERTESRSRGMTPRWQDRAPSVQSAPSRRIRPIAHTPGSSLTTIMKPVGLVDCCVIDVTPASAWLPMTRSAFPLWSPTSPHTGDAGRSRLYALRSVENGFRVLPASRRSRWRSLLGVQVVLAGSRAGQIAATGHQGWTETLPAVWRVEAVWRLWRETQGQSGREPAVVVPWVRLSLCQQ
jgi:hypothetical protein